MDDRLGVLGLPHRPAVSERVRWIRSLLETGDVRAVCQPVVRLGTVVAFEPLSRFHPQRFPSPVHAFAAASAAGVTVDLELLALRSALRRVPDLPDGMPLSVNLSAEALTDPRTLDLLLPHKPAVGVEVTERTPVQDYAALTAGTDRLKQAGLQVAVDDAGAGFASLRHVLQLRPRAIELDMALVRGIDGDPVRQALVRAVAEFARGIDARLVAEGIETEEERAALLDLGILLGQGYLLGRPGPWEAALGADAG